MFWKMFTTLLCVAAATALFGWTGRFHLVVGLPMLVLVAVLGWKLATRDDDEMDDLRDIDDDKPGVGHSLFVGGLQGAVVVGVLALAFVGVSSTPLRAFIEGPDCRAILGQIDILAYARGRASPSAEAMALDADYERLRAEVYDALCQTTFTHGTSPPHHLVALGFRLWPDPAPEDMGTRTPPGKPSPVWPPRRIVAELSDTALTTLVRQLEEGLARAVTYLSEARIRDHLRQLRQRMEQSVHAICMQLQLDLPPWCVSVVWHHGSGVGLTETLDDLKRSIIVDRLRQCRVGTTMFRHYYTTPKPEDDIGHWCEAVKRQVWQAIRTQGTGHLFVRLQQVEARKQRDTARRAPARQPQHQQPPPQAPDDSSRR